MLSCKLDKDFEFVAVQKVFICAAERLFIFRVNTSVIQTYMKIINKVNYSICFAIHISLLWIIIKISLLKIYTHTDTRYTNSAMILLKQVWHWDVAIC